MLSISQEFEQHFATTYRAASAKINWYMREATSLNPTMAHNLSGLNKKIFGGTGRKELDDSAEDVPMPKDLGFQLRDGEWRVGCLILETHESAEGCQSRAARIELRFVAMCGTGNALP